jgi:molecular chaperone HtpG
MIDEIISFEPFSIESDKEILAIGWYGLTKTLQRIPVYNEAHGIRLRKGNIQIGDHLTFQRFFSEERFHNYFVGELHIVSTKLLPNGQRDYFDECPEISEFEKKLKFFTSKLSRLCHDVSEINSSISKIKSYQINNDIFIKKQKDYEFVSANHANEENEKNQKLLTDANSAQNKLEKISNKAATNTPLQKILDKRKSDYCVNEKTQPNVNTNNEENNKTKIKFKSQKFSQLNRKEQKFIGEIFDIIISVLAPDLAQNLILKIEEKFGGKTKK